MHGAIVHSLEVMYLVEYLCNAAHFQGWSPICSDSLAPATRIKLHQGHPLSEPAGLQQADAMGLFEAARLS